MRHLVAVYGTLKHGFGNHRHYMHAAEFLGAGATEVAYEMRDVGGFPVTFDDNPIAPAAIEVYSVSNETLAKLDQLEGNGHMFVRKQINVLQSDGGTKHLPPLHVWMYFGVPEFWNDRKRLSQVVVGEDGLFNWGHPVKRIRGGA